MNNKLKGGLTDKKTLSDIIKKHSKENTDMSSVIKKQLQMGMRVEMEHTNDTNKAREIAMDHLWEDPKYYSKLKKIESNNMEEQYDDPQDETSEPPIINTTSDWRKRRKKAETKESMGASSSGSFEAPLFGKSIQKRKIHSFHNSNLDEALGGTEMGSYDVPFLGSSPKGRKDPLKISGPESIKKSRAVKDKNFPKWGGPGGVFIKIKDKCKKFPYCNQGDINAIEILKENIDIIHSKTGIPRKEIENIVLNEIKQIFI